MARAAASESRLDGLLPSLRSIRTPLTKRKYVSRRTATAPTTSNDQAATTPEADSDRMSSYSQAARAQSTASPRTTALLNFRRSWSTLTQKTRRRSAAGA